MARTAALPFMELSFRDSVEKCLEEYCEHRSSSGDPEPEHETKKQKDSLDPEGEVRGYLVSVMTRML